MWQPWFAWHPVRLGRQWVWLKRIYRQQLNTYVDHDDWARYRYGTVLDILKSTEATP
jgi:hypothetical protein